MQRMWLSTLVGLTWGLEHSGVGLGRPPTIHQAKQVKVGKQRRADELAPSVTCLRPSANVVFEHRNVGKLKAPQKSSEGR